MATFTGLFERLDPDDNVRGKQFEHIVKWYLEHDPVYWRQLTHVWLWRNWPGRWGRDAGIDLVAEHRDGTLWAIQAKAYDPDYWVTKKDVDTFLTESNRRFTWMGKEGCQFAYRLLVATTDHVGPTAKAAIGDQIIDVGRLLRSHLDTVEIDWPASPSDLRAPKRPPKTPKPHQLEALNDLVEKFNEFDRGQFISACGTGKTLTTLFLREKLSAERTLVLVPSLGLMKQWVGEWIPNTPVDLEFLAVCSDHTVSEDDEIPVRTSDLGFPVTTDAEKIAVFLRKRSGPRVVFATYQSSREIANAFKLSRVPAFDLAIADEAHRTATAHRSGFATILSSEKIKAHRRLFMTATQRTYSERVLATGREVGFEFASMDEEEKFGPVFHRLGFRAAIDRGLLSDYQLIIIGVDSAIYCNWVHERQLIYVDGSADKTNAGAGAAQIALLKAMRKYGVHGVITYHSRIKDACAFGPSLKEWMARVPARQRPKGELHTDAVDGRMSATERQGRLLPLRRANENNCVVISNARCLSEGIDVPTLDGVAFIDPKRSVIDVAQAIGRAMRTAPGKEIATILIPVPIFLPAVDEAQNPEAILDDSAFEPVWRTVRAIRSLDEEVGEQLDDLRRMLGRHPKIKVGPHKLPHKEKVDIPDVVGKEFAEAFSLRLVEMTTASWEFWLGLMERYIHDNDNSSVPARYKTDDGHPLGAWVNTQRANYQTKNKWLSAERISQLESLLGWTWDLHEDLFKVGLDHLREYAKNNAGDTSPPLKYVAEDGYKLGVWVNTVRSRRGKLSPDRIRQLEELDGWEWNPRDARFRVGLNHLRDYRKCYGDARPVRGYKAKDGYPLGDWVNTQRAFYRKEPKGISPDRIRQLEEVDGWEWAPKYGPKKDAIMAAWEKGFCHLLQYIDRRGEIPLVVAELDGYKVGKWVASQREDYRHGALDPDRIRRLEELDGWEWNIGKGRPGKPRR